MRRLVTMISVVGAAASLCYAGDWQVDPVHSSVGFSVRHLMISNVKGAFTNYSGTAKFDPADPSSFTVEGTIETASVDTGNAMRDKDLRSANFFDVQKYPVITFKSKELKKVADGSYLLTGDLGMHGVTNTVTLQLAGLAAPASFMGQTRMGFSITGKIERDKFGLTYNKLLETGGAVVGNDVQIAVDIEVFQKAKPATP